MRITEIERILTIGTGREAPDVWADISAHDLGGIEAFVDSSGANAHPMLLMTSTAAVVVLIAVAGTFVLRNLTNSLRATQIAGATTAAAPTVSANLYADATPVSSQLVLNLPMMPAEPKIIRFGHKLYITNSVFNDKNTAAPSDLIGTLLHYGSGDIPVYAVAGAPDSICILQTFIQPIPVQKVYLRYNYLCDDRFDVQGRTVEISTMTEKSPIIDATGLTPGSTAAEPTRNAASSYTFVWDYLTSYPVVLQHIQAILGDAIGEIPTGGTIYAITGIDPVNAVYVNIGDRWFLVSKAEGYTGKTVYELMPAPVYYGPIN